MTFRIVIAEDETTTAAILRTQLESLGLVAKVVNNGAELVADLEQATANAIVTDINMPEMNGLDAVKKIRGMPGYEKVPILGMSAADHQTREAAVDAGFDCVFRKPVDAQKIVTKIVQLVKRNQAA